MRWSDAEWILCQMRLQIGWKLRCSYEGLLEVNREICKKQVVQEVALPKAMPVWPKAREADFQIEDLKTAPKSPQLSVPFPPCTSCKFLDLPKEHGKVPSGRRTNDEAFYRDTD